jgi:hypothetical protein
MDPKTGKLYDSVQDAKDDGVKNPVEISGRKKEIAFVSEALSKAYKKQKKKERKRAKDTRKRNR